MVAIVDDAALVDLCYEHSFSLEDIVEAVKAKAKNPKHVRPARILSRIETLRKKGLLPLDSGNSVSAGETLVGSSTLYDDQGNIRLQWVKTNVPKQQQLDAVKEAITELAETLPSITNVTTPKPKKLDDELITVYISNDLHLGAYMWHEEVGVDWDVNVASNTIRQAYDRLVATTPNSKKCIVVDLGDLSEVNDHKNMTPQSGHILDVDGRYPKILRAAYESLIYGIYKALEKHELVYFYCVPGNHDKSTNHAVREVIRMVFKDNPRVIVDESPAEIKYHQHGSTLLQFAHGDGLKMAAAGEVMAHDCSDIFSQTKFRYSHMGHVHKDSAMDTRLCKVESHRNLAPLNAWAYHKGFRGPLGTMKAVTYSDKLGELTRQTYNVLMD
jgi:hypothetical protein